VFLAGASFSTMAIFTDSDSIDANSFTAGTVDLTTNPTTQLVLDPDMAPGDEVTNPVTVTNAGTLDLRYAITSTTTEDTFAAVLQLTIKTGVTACTNGGFDTDGTVIYGPALVGTIAGTDIIGEPAQGAQSDERTLVSLANEVLCFNVELPIGTGNSSQGDSTTATLVFASEQTINN